MNVTFHSLPRWLSTCSKRAGLRVCQDLSIFLLALGGAAGDGLLRCRLAVVKVAVCVVSRDGGERERQAAGDEKCGDGRGRGSVHFEFLVESVGRCRNADSLAGGNAQRAGTGKVLAEIAGRDLVVKPDSVATRLGPRGPSLTPAPSHRRVTSLAKVQPWSEPSLRMWRRDGAFPDG